jgi:hypothetical protein
VSRNKTIEEAIDRSYAVSRHFSQNLSQQEKMKMNAKIQDHALEQYSDETAMDIEDKL